MAAPAPGALAGTLKNTSQGMGKTGAYDVIKSMPGEINFRGLSFGG